MTGGTDLQPLDNRGTWRMSGASLGGNEVSRIGLSV